MSSKIPVNMSEYDPSGFGVHDEGVFVAEVESCDVKESREAGHTYLSIRLRNAVTGKFICFDTTMLEGGGLNIGLGKLLELGVPPDAKSVDPDTLVGQRVHVAVAHREYKGKRQAGVDINYEGFRCGYKSLAGATLTVPFGGGDFLDPEKTPF